MSDSQHEFDTDADRTRPGQHSNAPLIFGSIFAFIVLAGFSFGVWAGATRPKPAETADKQKDKEKDPAPGSSGTPSGKPANPGANPGGNPPGNPNGNPGGNPNPGGMPADPKPKDPDPKPKDPEPKPKDPDPKPPAGKPDGTALALISTGLAKEPEPKTPVVVGKAVSFKTDVAPIFVKYCNTCHGASAGKPKGGLDLRTVAAIMKGGDNGDALKVGDPKKSTLYTSMLPGASEQMPPDGKPQPTDKEKQVIHDWIAGGAKPRRTVRRRRRLELTQEGSAG